jgi:hypothetical protein
VIDKMNEELSELQKKYSDLEKIHKEYKKTHVEEIFLIPKIRVNSINELKERIKKIKASIGIFHKIIYDFLKHEGWILEYDRPDRIGTDLMGYAGCGFWDTWEHDILNWGDTTAQEFYYEHLCNTTYSLYLKCKILDELYKLFPEYKNREKGWFHQEIDACFGSVETTIGTILENTEQIQKNQLYDIIYKIIMTQLFGWGREIDDWTPGYERTGIFPKNFEFENGEYIQNILYYHCEKCNKKIVGEEFILDHMDGDFSWYSGDDWELCEEPCRCCI